MKRLLKYLLGVAVLSFAIPAVAAAEPVVNAGGKPGVATSWTSSADAVTLTIKEGFNAAQVADAITKNVKGATAKAEGSKVVVTGMPQAKLLTALEKVQVSDDVDSMFAAMQGTGSEDEGSGSSIRATKSADFSAVIGDRADEVSAKVVEVKQGRFPSSVLTVKITGDVPAKVKEQGLKKGALVTIVPRIPMTNGTIDPNDPQATMNAGAFYSREGDKISFHVEGKAKDKDVWIVTGLRRK